MLWEITFWYLTIFYSYGSWATHKRITKRTNNVNKCTENAFIQASPLAGAPHLMSSSNSKVLSLQLFKILFSMHKYLFVAFYYQFNTIMRHSLRESWQQQRNVSRYSQKQLLIKNFANKFAKQTHFSRISNWMRD